MMSNAGFIAQVCVAVLGGFNPFFFESVSSCNLYYLDLFTTEKIEHKPLKTK